MPRYSKHYVPSYRRHTASGQARVEIDGHTIYLGPWKSKASYEEYDRVIKQYFQERAESAIGKS